MTHGSGVVVHVIRVVAITLVIVVCLFLPLLPGRYDALAMPLSVMAQMAGVAGLILVPIGAAWLIYEWRTWRAGANGSENDKGYYFAMAGVVVAAIVGLVVCLGALMGAGFSLGIGMLVLWAYALWRMTLRLKRLKTRGRAAFNPAPIYLVVIPAVVALTQFTMLGRAAEISREMVIRRSAELINEIEQYYRTRGHYPPSLLALWQDYDTGLVGVPQFHYEPNGDAYNVYFEHLSTTFGTREIVMYNKRDEHNFLSHDSDRLLWTPEQIRSRRTYYAVNDAMTPHWKRFMFD